MREDHGYARYTSKTDPCRCNTCRAAKANYMRTRRATARALARRFTRSSSGARGNRHNAWAPGAERYVAPIPRHGTRYGYEEAGCRCNDCTTARTSSDKPRRDTTDA